MNPRLKKAALWVLGIIVSAVISGLITALMTEQPLTGLIKLKGLYETFLQSRVPAWAFALVFLIAILGLYGAVRQLPNRLASKRENSKPLQTTASGPTSVSAPNVPAAAAPEPRFNFFNSDVYVVSVLEDRDSYIPVEHPEFYRGFCRPLPALAIEITNRPHKEFRVEYASDVFAELVVVKDAPIGPLIWQGEAKSEIDFESGHPQRLILAVGESQYSEKWLIPRYNLRVTEDGYRRISTDHMVPKGIDERILLTLSSHSKVIHEIPLYWKWDVDKKVPSITVIRS